MTMQPDLDTTLLYWRGMVDAEIASMDHRVNAIETAALRVNMENSSKLDHLSARIEAVSLMNVQQLHELRLCLDARGSTINKMIGGLAVLAVLLQFLMPIVLKFLLTSHT